MTRQIANKIRYHDQMYMIRDEGHLFTPEMVGLKVGPGLSTACRRGYYYEAEIINLRLTLTNLALMGTEFQPLFGCNAVIGERRGMGLYNNLSIPLLTSGQVIANMMTPDDTNYHTATGKRVILDFRDGVLQNEHLLSMPGLLERFRKLIGKGS